MSSFRRRLSLSGAFSVCFAAPALAVPAVAVDIAPIHSIVSRVMSGVGEPGLVLPPGASPHGYSLRPSEAALIERADVVVWVGPSLAPWLEHPVEALAGKAKVLTLQEAPGVRTLPVRVDGPFEPDLDHHDEAEHEGEDHDHEGIDPHIWLDPENAVAFATDIADALGAVDPANAATYSANAKTFATEMAGLTAAIHADLDPARGKPFIVFHDAYQYFEKRFDFPAAGSISLAEGEAPTPGRVAEIQDRVKRDGVVCAFAEPQFEPKLLQTVIEGTDVRTGVLDPDAGTGLTPGPDLYPQMLLRIATTLADCLDK